VAFVDQLPIVRSPPVQIRAAALLSRFVRQQTELTRSPSAPENQALLSSFFSRFARIATSRGLCNNRNFEEIRSNRYFSGLARLFKRAENFLNAH
jgi:hypothetical protein